jgi:hypothetical protein
MTGMPSGRWAREALTDPALPPYESVWVYWTPAGKVVSYSPLCPFSRHLLVMLQAFRAGISKKIPV